MLELRPRAGAEASARSVSLVLERLPQPACPQGHHVDPLSTTQRDRLVTTVLGHLPAARRRLLGRRQRCTACGADLRMPARRTRRTVTVDDPDLGVVTVTFDLALTRCPECGHDQAPRAAARDATEALRAALSAAGTDDRHT